MVVSAFVFDVVVVGPQKSDKHGGDGKRVFRCRDRTRRLWSRALVGVAETDRQTHRQVDRPPEYGR